jgi:hypothetical protein
MGRSADDQQTGLADPGVVGLGDRDEPDSGPRIGLPRPGRDRLGDQPGVPEQALVHDGDIHHGHPLSGFIGLSAAHAGW